MNQKTFRRTKYRSGVTAKIVLNSVRITVANLSEVEIITIVISNKFATFAFTYKPSPRKE